MNSIRLGDEFEGVVEKVRELTGRSCPPSLRTNVRLLTVGIALPGKKLPHYTQVSWNIVKLGPFPEVDDTIILVYTEPWFAVERKTLSRGRFVPKKLLNPTHECDFGAPELEPNHEKEFNFMGKCMLGEVSRDLHRCATYVRVNIPSREPEGYPLAIKATQSNFPRHLFKKGTVVEVEQANTDCRRYRIVSVFDKVGRSLPEDECDFGAPEPEVQPKVRPERKLRFFLGRRYFGEPGQRSDLLRALNGAFPISLSEMRRLTSSGQNYGFWIVCTEAQFACFLISRDRVGLPNGFQDLRVDYLDEDSGSPDREVDVSSR